VEKKKLTRNSREVQNGKEMAAVTKPRCCQIPYSYDLYLSNYTCIATAIYKQLKKLAEIFFIIVFINGRSKSILTCKMKKKWWFSQNQHAVLNLIFFGIYLSSCSYITRFF